ncbi:MAG: NAD(P)-dependent oxidoreductase [Planctomycetota bacterium]
MVLITGGAGFLGYHVARGFSERGLQLVLLDVARFHEAEYPKGTIFHQADVRDRDALRRVFSNQPVDVVIHTAAALPLEKKRTIYEVNVEGVRNVFQAAKDAGVPRVVFIGSTAVYGVPDKHPLFEDDPLVGVGPYGHTKIEGERICQEFRECGMTVAILRPKTFVGTGRLGVFQILYDWVESGCRIPMIGWGKNRYQLLEVEDLVDAIHRCATGDSSLVSDTFNVGAKEFKTVREDMQALCDYAKSGARPMGTPAKLIKPMLMVLETLHLSPLYKWVYGTADKDSFVSTEKIETKLGWSPKYSNAAAMIRSYQWYLEHKTESDSATGLTHRVAWKQGALRCAKWVLR